MDALWAWLYRPRGISYGALTGAAFLGWYARDLTSRIHRRTP